MKFSAIGAIAFSLTASLNAQVVYNDTVGDLNDGTAGGDDLSVWPHLDITSVEVNNDANNIMFKITLNGDILAVNWGKYMIGIDSVSGVEPTGACCSQPPTDFEDQGRHRATSTPTSIIVLIN